MKRHQQILLGVLVLQIVLSVIVFWPRKAVTGSSDPVFPDLKAEDVVGLMLMDNTGAQITVRKVNGSWVLPDAGEYPVNESNITTLLTKLVSLDKATLVARTEASHAPLQVSSDTFQRRVDFTTADGKTTTLYLGSAPRYTATHFRVEGETETYLTVDLASYDVNVRFSSWVDTAYGQLDQATIKRVVLENKQGTFELVKDGDAWTLADLAEGEQLNTANVETIVRNASNMSLLRPLGKTEEASYGLDDPNAVITLVTDDRVIHRFTIGARDASDNSYVIKSSDSAYYVRTSEYNVKAMVENDRSDFLQEPEAAPTTAPSEP